MADRLIERPRNLAFLLAELPGTLSRDVVTIASGSGIVDPGTALGKILIGAIAAAAKAGGNTGNGTISAVTALAGAKFGVYKLRFTSATAWTLTDPDGFALAAGANGAANANDLAFTTTAGGTAFVAGDGFDINVAQGSGKYVPSADAAVDGSQNAIAINGYRVDATSADVDAVVIANDAEVKDPMLIFHASVSDDTKRAAKLSQLRTVNIKAR